MNNFISKSVAATTVSTVFPKRIKVSARGNASLLIAVSVGIGYALTTGLWIAYSSTLVVEIAHSRQQLLLLEHYKAMAFVALMAVTIAMLAYFLHKQGREIERMRSANWLDATTGLMNRSAAIALLRSLFSDAASQNKTFGVLLLDIRQLRRINHALGRSAGDEVLRSVARSLRAFAETKSSVARLESDSFLLTLPLGITEREAEAFAKRVLALFDAPLQIHDQEIKVDLSGGMALAPTHGATVFDLMDTVMRARERCLPEGRELCIADLRDRSGHKELLELEVQLRRAIRNNEFSLAFQPKVDLSTFEVAGAEALVRWNHPTRGIVSPAEFIPLAESHGLIGDITEQVLDKALAACADWRRRSLKSVQVSVNLSIIDLKGDRIVPCIQRLLRHNRLPAHYLILEITESWLMDDPESALCKLHALRDLGVSISIDDFGTGYSSLEQLIRFPVDRFKIDRSFVSGADRDPKKRAILEAIKHIASSLGAQTVAEGAETFDELIVLKQIGFDQVQGYVIAPPLRPGDFTEHYLQPGAMPAEHEAILWVLDKLADRKARIQKA